MANISIFRIIVNAFSYKKKASPLILFVIEKNLMINLHHIIVSLDLAISFRV